MQPYALLGPPTEATHLKPCIPYIATQQANKPKVADLPRIEISACPAGVITALSCATVPSTPADCYVGAQNLGSACGLTTEGQVEELSIIIHCVHAVNTHQLVFFYHGYAYELTVAEMSGISK